MLIVTKQGWAAASWANGWLMHYYDRVKFWIVMIPLWLIALAALAGVLILPGGLDVYYHDTYMVVAKVHIILAILLGFVLPLLWLTIRHVRSTSI
jgi:hypothetical protein